MIYLETINQAPIKYQSGIDGEPRTKSQSSIKVEYNQAYINNKN